MATQTKRPPRAETAYGTLSEERLRALLDDDCETGSIVAVRGNKISRKRYAKILGCAPSALTRFSYIFDEYEHKLVVRTGPSSPTPVMFEWVNAAYEARELQIRGGKLDRSSFRKHFELRDENFINKCPPIRSLFEELEARAESEGYLSSEMHVELDRVRTVLAGQPTLNRDRVTICLVELAKVARVAKSRFRNRPFVKF